MDVSVYSAMFGLRLYMLCVILRRSTWAPERGILFLRPLVFVVVLFAGLRSPGFKLSFRPRGLYRTMCHLDSSAHFFVPGVAGMSGLIGSWRPWAYPAWTI